MVTTLVQNGVYGAFTKRLVKIAGAMIEIKKVDLFWVAQHRSTHDSSGC